MMRGDRSHVIAVVKSRDGTLPLLFVDGPAGGGIMREQVALVRHIAGQGYSPSQQMKLTESIGRFCDWMQLAESGTMPTPETLPAILRRFLVARYEGTVQRDGSDPTGLFWRPAKAQTVEMDRRHLNKLSDFVAREFGYFPLNPDTRIEGYHHGRGAVREVEMVLSSRRQQLDFLGHVAHKRAPRPLRVIGPVSHRRPQREDDGHAFPLERLGDLIANEPSVVKRMIFIELAFGGPRISEALNHFVTDVLPGTHRPKLFPDDRPSDLPLVVLADPMASVFTDTLQFSTEDRRQYLRRRFDMLSRPDRPRRGDPLHAGWKGMLYDNTNLLVSQVYWSHPEWARTYWRLYSELLEIRRSVPKGVRESHPYLYINDSVHRSEFGQPVKIHGIEKAFVRACERIGLEPYRGKVSLHGLRHAYKRQLRLLGVKPSTIQRCMHQASLVSQDAYDKASAADINAALQALGGSHAY
jgi:Phage integrase family.